MLLWLACAATLSLLSRSEADLTPALYVVEAGRSSQKGPKLVDGTTLCPTTFYDRGLSILCDSGIFAGSADFYINDEKVYHDDEYPFYINGDRRGRVKKWRNWRNYKGMSTIKCVLNDDTSVEVTLIISCRQNTGPLPPSLGIGPDVGPPPGSIHPSGALLLRPAGTIEGPGTLMTEDFTFCDRLYPGGFTMECVASQYSRFARFYVNGARVWTERAKPYFIAGDSNNVAYAWRPKLQGQSFELKCMLSDRLSSVSKVTIFCDEDVALPSLEASDEEESGSEEADLDEASTGGDSSKDGGGNRDNGYGKESRFGCVVIDARGTTLSKGWEVRGDGVAFKPDDVGGGGIAQAGKFVLEYLFTAPVKSQYAFVIEMTTSHGTEHNDVWARFPEGGFQFVRKGVLHESTKAGWVKAYHNRKGRAPLALSIDFNPHSISTNRVLEEGEEYTVLLSGRSSKVTVHNIIMFPCAQMCDTYTFPCPKTKCHTSKPWNDQLEKCLALTD